MFHGGASFCVVRGCHARSTDDDESFWQRLCAGDPRFCLIERGREAFSRLIKSNWGKLKPKKMQKVHGEGMGGFHFDVEMAFDTVRRGRGFALEQPAFEMCVAGMLLHPDGGTEGKTGWITNDEGLFQEISRLQCFGRHAHVPKPVPLLNLVCNGSNLPIVARLTGIMQSSGTSSAEAVWITFLGTSLKRLYEFQMVITDGGPEFQGPFLCRLEQHGIFQYVGDTDAPWHKARPERHGGWVKEEVEQELVNGTATPGTMRDLDDFVFDGNPRMPHMLLSDDSMGDMVLKDNLDPIPADSAAGEIAQKFQIRQTTRTRCMEKHSKDRIALDKRTAELVDGKYAPGQWVVFWRCNVDQIRPALRGEVLGAATLQDSELPKLTLGGLRSGLQGSA